MAPSSPNGPEQARPHTHPHSESTDSKWAQQFKGTARRRAEKADRGASRLGGACAAGLLHGLGRSPELVQARFQIIVSQLTQDSAFDETPVLTIHGQAARAAQPGMARFHTTPGSRGRDIRRRGDKAGRSFIRARLTARQMSAAPKAEVRRTQKLPSSTRRECPVIVHLAVRWVTAND